ncbi:uncharacterized protein LY89DRAFT_731060 [Mollisia scopiformis]|uniref:Uncharacterized protein n=1 Tax=Mollisia scopiformis TaxID=149040 RepID=A0A194XI56_MOLSC|nr:uncharacterized protein LY89DRAFT_731060 [Mollisia scopiformis]KUJ19809.1 hypothetical protein LY89DRAFT_731060 [Mollisia scopiformis]
MATPQTSECKGSSEDLSETPASKGRWKSKGPNFSDPAAMVTFIVASQELRNRSLFIKRKSRAAHSVSWSKWFYGEKFEVFYEADIIHDRKNPSSKEETDDDETAKLLAAQDLDLVQLWVVADKLLVPRLQNVVIRSLQDIWGSISIGPSSDWIPYVYEHTGPDSPLRHLVVDTCAYDLHPKRFLNHPESFSHEMLLDLATVFAAAVSEVDSEKGKSKEGGDNSDKIPNEERSSKRPKYACNRAWRSYLVPEDD